ncbi:LOW QUALITY PROTEIN: hypothetical protein PanWU01x14_160680 [Parasponia andersonii]|uniref:Uncharacterized protein n=1 Tax=Parasponia andersonii TaxID=3476 RepID=A0A2P5CE35_PARAD|nr:LOW QUALITY PROTEIN: hypothetical protein PanWU01x14_160680 [Parasponia andersonii]
MPPNLKPCRAFQRCDNSLHLQVVVETVNALFSSDTTHLVSAERNCSIKDIKAIDPYGTNAQCACQGVGSVHVLCKDSSSKTVVSVICPSYHLIKVPAISQDVSPDRMAEPCGDI